MCFISFSAFAQIDTIDKTQLQKIDKKKISLKDTLIHNKKDLINNSQKFKNIHDTLNSALAKRPIDSLFLLDSLRKNDSLQIAIKKADSIKKINEWKFTLLDKQDKSNYDSIFGGDYIPNKLKSIPILENERKSQSKDEIFYVLVGLVALIAFTKILNPKYFVSMFSLFFQASFRQKQAIEQLSNNNLSSLLLNIVFVVCLSIYITILFEMKGFLHGNFWIILIITMIVLACIYIVKFIFLSFMGWVFNQQEAINSYNLIVFLSNKILAIVILPFVFLLAFNRSQIAEVCLIITYFILFLLLLYRFIVVIMQIRRNLKINALHFFLYICGVEVLPLLLIYKTVFNLISTSI